MTELTAPAVLDDLDVALLSALNSHPRIGDLELSRVASVARATVHSRSNVCKSSA